MRRKKLLVLIIIVGLFLAVIPGCITPGITPVQSNPPGERTLESQVGSASIAELPDFSHLVESAKSSVVAVKAESIAFNSSNEAYTKLELGSGWILDEKGIIVTNNHVIEGSSVIYVELYDRTEYKVESFNADRVTDIAVLKIKPKVKLKSLPVADTSNLKEGKWVLVMGNPVGKGISAKQGIISRLGVTMSFTSEQVYSNLIETSAAMNPGNSGGPLINLDGEIVGINTLKIDETGVEGMAYAINISDAMPIIGVLLAGQQVPHAWLGVDVLTFDNKYDASVNTRVEKGALVTNVSRGSPANQIGITSGDIITRFNDKTVTSAEDLIGLSKLSLSGQRVKITFWQGKIQKTRKISLVEDPALSTPPPQP